MGPWLLALAAPLARRVLIALGIGLVTYVGVDAIFTLLQNQVLGQIGSISGDIAQLLAIMGFQKSVGILLGAISTRLSLVQLTKWGKT